MDKFAIGPFGQCWDEQMLSSYKRSTYLTIRRTEICDKVFTQALDKATTSTNIQVEIPATGIHPFDLSIITHEVNIFASSLVTQSEEAPVCNIMLQIELSAPSALSENELGLILLYLVHLA
jgi:hypothetical protein